MGNETLFISFSTQKGGVGKSTCTVLAADWFYYYLGKNVAIIDCDFPQHSIDELRNREKKALIESERYKLMMLRQFDNYEKKAYPVLRCKPENAITTVKEFLENSEQHYDVILFDLPGTINTAGVLYTLSSLDYIFVPMRADRLVMQSTINFAKTITDRFVKNPAANTKDVFLFWNMVDRRERPDLCTPFELVLDKLKLQHFETRIPVRSKFNKEFADTDGEIYRSTIFVPDKNFLLECGFANLMDEICAVLKL